MENLTVAIIIIGLVIFLGVGGAHLFNQYQQSWIKENCIAYVCSGEGFWSGCDCTQLKEQEEKLNSKVE